MTSPVDFISGPSTGSTPRKRAKGMTASFTETCFGLGVAKSPCFASEIPAMASAAFLAKGTPVALPTKGTVRLARGFTSRT